ncbi:probable ATP-dependent RNA helicase kurz [Macrosteles quadrilineatus]|uniref:probable ATP-dependent RNA helicase kurz n=1 Tax=Macrosteles quadrilineatus TaxID=74068 RepID=UPI0023E24EFA|nr:probable ATP-dependent RNA helicase kurz [Macrosteles quadrilineatus]
MGKKGYNWKARQVVNTVVENSSNSKVQLELTTKKNEPYDDCNTLVIPSKKRKTVKTKTNGPVVTKVLSKTQRKKLEKIVERKKKKENRSTILEALSKVQAPEELLNKLTTIASLQTKGLKRHNNEEQKAINSIAGSRKKRMKLLQEEAKGQSSLLTDDPNIVGFDPSDTDSSADEDVDIKEEPEDIDQVKVTNTELQKDLINTNETKSENLNSVTIDITDDNEINNKVTHKDNTLKLKEEKDKVIKVESVPSIFIPVNRDEKIQEGRLKLPILGEEQAIMEAIRENPIVLLAGETGSGKTTQVPQFLYEAGYASNNKLIGITEPRRVAAIAMSKRVGQELNMSEDKVSYLIRFEGNTTPNTQIKFMTDGVLLKELQTDFLLNKYSVIILDEAHERSVYTDILIGLLSRIVPVRNKRGNPLKLIIMSATLRLTDFTENTRLFKTPPPVIKVESRQFPVTIHFNKQTPQDYVKEAYRKACKIHTQLPEGGILIFLTGQQEVNLVVKKLRKAFPLRSQKQNNLVSDKTEEKDKEDVEEDEVDEDLKDAMKKAKQSKRKQKKSPAPLPVINLDNYELNPQDDTEGDMLDDGSEAEEGWEEEETFTTVQPLWVLPLFSLLPSHKQAKVFEPPPEGCRLCVVATNVAETSLTIPNVKYVVDCGKVKTRLYDAHTGVSTFDVLWTSKASANQRAGRAGRTSAGHCYRLYSSAVFNDEFCEWAVPEMQRRPVDELLLQMKSLGIDRVVNFPFPSPPDVTQLQTAEHRLTLLGALQPPKKKDACSSKLTPLGQTMSMFPVAPRFAKMLCLSHQSGLLGYTLAIVAALSVQEFLLSGDKHWLKLRRQWAGMGNSLLLGDVMVLLRAVGAAEYANSNSHLERFCTLHGLRHKAVVECRKLRLQLTNQLNLQLPGLSLVVDPKMIPPTDTQARQLRQIVLAGMVDQVALKLTDEELTSRGLRKGKPVYQTPEMEEVVHMPSTSALYKAAPEWIVYQEIFQTDKMYFRGVTAIEPEWLPVFAPTLCNLSSPLTEPPPRYNEDTGVVYCHFSGSFGKRGWPLPVTELEFPEGLDRYKWFAVFFLNGSVCPKLKKYSKNLLSTPQTMVKSWAGLQPRTEILLKTLVAAQVDSKSSLLEKWEDEPKYLLNAYQSWLPESAHNEVAVLWPPL